jgi:hypothetical protein
MASQNLQNFKNAEGRFKLDVLAIISIIIFFVLIFHWNVLQHYQYPTGSDQDSYLIHAKTFVERGVFSERAPFYTVWLSLFYLLSGGDFQLCLMYEKATLILLLSLFTALICRRIFDWRTGIFAGCWVLNCKYFILEPNGSNSIVAVLITGSLISLFYLAESIRLPVSFFCLYLAAMVRPEIWFLIGAIILGQLLTNREFQIRNCLKKESLRNYLHPAWLLNIILCTSFFIYSEVMMDNKLKGIHQEAFRQNFAVNFIERKDLEAKYQQKWHAIDDIWKNYFSDANDIKTLILRYPKEMTNHLEYNMKLATRAVPAAIFGLLNNTLLVIAILLYSIFEYKFPIPKRFHNDDGTLECEIKWIVVWGISTGIIIIPMTLFFRTAARYYIPLIPFLIIAIVCTIRQFISGSHTIYNRINMLKLKN